MSLIGTQEKYLHTTLDVVREINNTLITYSIPRDFTGIRIEPRTVVMEFTSSDSSNTGIIQDRGDGRLYLEAIDTVVGGVEVGSEVGDVLYPHGILNIVESGESNAFFNLLSGSENYEITWKSNQPIYTATYLCKVSDFEFNFTLNESAILSGSEGFLIPEISNADFRTYITGIGLFNESNELLAVAKFGQPIPKSSKVDMTFVITLDY